MNDTVPMKSLADVCDILDSQRIPVTARDRVKGCYPYYGANGIQDYVDKYIFDDELVLLAEDGGNFGSKENPIAYRVSGKCWVNNHAHVLKPHDNTDVDFLCYALMFYNTEGLVNGATRQKLTQSAMKKMMIPFYDLKRQQEIVNELNAITHLISLRQRQAEKLDELVKARFVEMFGGAYPEVIAEDVCERIVDCPHSTPKYDESELKYPAIRTSEIQDGQIEWSSMKYVGVNEYERRVKRLIPEAGDIVYAREGTYGDCVILPESHHFCLGQRTMLFRPNYKLCNSEYLHAALKSAAVKYQADMSNAGSTVPHVNVSDAKRFHFPLPPLSLQNAFATFIHEIDREKERIQKSAALLETLKRSLMQQYFG